MTGTTAAPKRAFELMLLGLLAFFWGASYLFVKIGLETITPLTLIAARVTIAALILLGIVLWQRYRLPSDWGTWSRLGKQSFLNSFGAWSLLAWGQQFVDSGLAGVLNSTSPIFVFFITLLITRHESLNLRKLIGAGLGVFGVVFIVGTDVLQGLGQQVAAQLAIVLGAIFYACAAIYGKRFAHLPAPVTAACIMLWSVVVMIPACILIEQPWTLQPSARSVIALLLLAVFSTAGALLLYFRLMHTLGSMGVASQGYLRSAFSVLLGMMILGETVTPTLGLGLIAAILGVALINWPTKTIAIAKGAQH